MANRDLYIKNDDYHIKLEEMYRDLRYFEEMQKNMSRDFIGRLYIQDSKLILIDRDENEIELTNMSDSSADSNIMAKIARILLIKDA